VEAAAMTRDDGKNKRKKDGKKGQKSLRARRKKASDKKSGRDKASRFLPCGFAFPTNLSPFDAFYTASVKALRGEG